MRPRTLALLFLVVAGLLAFIWLYERQLPSSDERLELAKRVLRLEADEVRAVTLRRSDSAVRLERFGDPADEEAEQGWRLLEPLAATADRFAVDQLVRELVGLEKSRTLDAADAAELGLADPRGRVTLETADVTLELKIGSAVPVSSTMIVGVGGRDEAYVVADRLWSELQKPAGDWRSKELGPESREAIQRITLDAVTLGRRGESFWVESPYVDRADRELVSSLLGEITGLRAESFVDDPASEPALDAGELEVVLAGREESLRVELGGPAGEAGDLRLARVDGQLVELRTELAEALERGAEEWRSRAWTSLQVYQVDRLEVRDGAAETVFERAGGEWLRDGTRVEYEPVSDLLYAITGVEATAVAAESTAAGEPVLTLALGGGDEERRETLTLYRAGPDGASPARVEGRQVTLLLGEGAVADLELKLSEARSAAEQPAEDGEEPVEEDL